MFKICDRKSVFQIVQGSLYLSCANLHDESVILKANLDQAFKYETLSHSKVSMYYEVQRMAAAACKKCYCLFLTFGGEKVTLIY